MSIQLNQKNALERRMQASANLAQKKALKQQRYITNKNILSKDSSIVEENTDTKSDANFLEKAWKTIADVGVNIGMGFGKAIEGIVDFGATAVGEVGGIFDKGFKEDVSDFIKRDYTGMIMNPLENYVGEDSIISGSKLESLIDGAAQGVGQLLPNVALNMVGLGAISMPSLFARSAGNATEEGLQNGANLERSAIYGIASGTVEVLTEGISERLFGKPTTVDRVLGKKAIKKGLLKSAENGLGRVFQEAGGEAIEEMVSEMVSPFLKQIYSADSFGEGVSNAIKEELTLEQWSNVLEAGVVGALTSLAFKPVDNTIRRFNTSYDNMVKLGEISSEVAEYNNYVNKIDAGISEGKIDTTSQLYKDAMVELNQKKANIQKKASEIQFRGNETKINKAQNQLLNSLDTNYGLTASYDENNKLQFNKTASSEKINNSYNQASYSTSLKGYENDFKYKPTSSAMTEDNLKGFELANKLAKASGQTSKIVFVDDLNINGNENNNNIKSNKINGMYDEESGIIYINKNASAEQVGQIAIMHEFTHSLEGTDAYFRFRNYLVNTLKNNPTLIKYLKVNTEKYGETIDSFAKKIAENYQNNGVELSDVDVLSEVVAKFTSEYLFTSQTQINRLCETDLSLGKRIFNWIKSKFSSMGSATKEDRQLKAFLKNAETLYQSAIRSAISKGAMERAYLDQIDKNKTTAKEEINVQENTQAKQTTQENSAENIDKTNSEKYSVDNEVKDEKIKQRHANNKVYKRNNGDEDIEWLEKLRTGKEELYEDRERERFREYIERNKLYELQQQEIDNLTINLKVLKKKAYPKIYKDIAFENKRQKVNTEFFISNIRNSNSTQILGFYEPKTRTIYLPVTSSKVDYVEINRHEKYHHYKSQGLDTSKFENIIDSNLSREQIRILFDKYKLLYPEFIHNLKLLDEEVYAQFFSDAEELDNSKAQIEAIKLLNEQVKKKYKLKTDIKFSINDDIDNDLKKDIGITYKWSETGYILKDGTQLDLSDKRNGGTPNSRSLDHREIFDNIDIGKLSNLEALIGFMQNGNIRVLPEYPGININLSKEPTEQQYRQIKSLIETLGYKNEYFVIDIDNKNGDTIESREYENNFSSKTIIDEIQNYFKEGKFPYRSELDAFRYSLNDDIDELFDDNISEKQEQSNNNETDEQSSKNETKEQAINIDVDEVKDTSHLKGQTKNTDAVKYRAKLNQEKVYSKTELDELIDNTINKTPDMRLDSKSQEIAVEYLFEKMNNQDNNERLETANTIADFIINNAYYDNFNNEFPSASQDIVDMVHGQKFQLSEQVRQELMFVYGKKQGQMIYNHYNDNSSKLTPETFVEETGLGIDLTNSEQDIFLDIYKAYNDAKATIKSYYDERNQLAKDVLTTEEIMSDKKVLVNEILKAYDEKGTKTAYAKLKEKYTNTINKLKNDLRDVKTYSDAFVEFMKANKEAKTLVHESYSASHLENPVVKAYLKEVSKTANIKTISKKAREEMQKLQRVYTLSGEDSMFKDIGNQYDNYEVFGENGEFDQTMADMISTIADGEGDLSANELKLLTRITNGLIHLYKNYDKTFIDGKYVETQKLAEKHLETVNKNLKQRDKTKILKFFWKFRNFIDAHTIWRNLDGYDMEYNPELGILQDKGFFSEFGKMITDGEVDFKVAEIGLLEPFGKFYKEHKDFVKRLTGKKDKIELELVKGTNETATSLKLENVKVEISLGEAISIYLTSLRPQANFKNTTITLKNKDGTTSVYKMTVEQVNAMYNDFDAVTKNYIKIVQEFFKKSGDLKAKVDKDLYGYTNVEDDGLYFPISRDISQIASNIGDAKLVAEILNAYNLSFNKDVKKGARQSLGILNVYEVIERHARGISMYYGLGIPLRTFNRVFNKRVGIAGEFQTSIKQTLSSVADATDYINNWLKDVQGFSYNNADKKWSKILSTVRGNYAKFQLGANPRTVLGQASSYLMGFTYLDMSSLSKGLTMKTDTKQMYEYAPFTKYRMVEKDAVKAQINVLDKMKNGVVGQVGEALTAPIGWMDNATVKKLWNACQVQVEKNAGFKIGTEDNLKKAGKLLELVVRETQSNNIMSEKTAFSRTKNELMSALSMFTSDAQKQLSRLIDSIGLNATIKSKIKSGELSKDSMEAKLGKKQIVKTATAFTLATSLYVAIGMFMNWLLGRRDDDESLLEEFAGDFADQVVGLFPIVKDIYGYISDGYELNNYALGMVNDLLSATVSMKDLVTKFASGQKVTKAEIGNPLRKTVYAVSQGLGLPTRNLYNYANGIIGKISPSTQYKMNTLFYSPKMNDLDKAIANEQTKLAETIMSEVYKSKNIEVELDFVKESVKLYKAGYSVIPSKIDTDFTYNDMVYSLTGKQQKELVSVAKNTLATSNEVITTKSYKNLSDKAKASYLKTNYNINYINAISQIVGENNLKDSDYKKYLFSKVLNSNSKLIEYMAYVSAIESDYDENGKAISGSRKDKVFKIINSLNISTAEKYLLMSFAGYKNTKGESEVKAYLKKQNLTKEEQEKILEWCGY